MRFFHEFEMKSGTVEEHIPEYSPHAITLVAGLAHPHAPDAVTYIRSEEPQPTWGLHKTAQSVLEAQNPLRRILGLELTQ